MCTCSHGAAFDYFLNASDMRKYNTSGPRNMVMCAKAAARGFDSLQLLKGKYITILSC